MHDILSNVTLNSLGGLLHRAEHAAVRADPELARLVREAAAFHGELSKNVQALVEEYRQLQKERESRSQ